MAACVSRATTKKIVNFFEEKVHPGDLAGGFSDLEITWLLYCAGAATGSFPRPQVFQEAILNLSEPDEKCERVVDVE